MFRLGPQMLSVYMAYSATDKATSAHITHIISRLAQVVEGLYYKAEGRRFKFRWGIWISSTYLLLPAAPRPSNRLCIRTLLGGGGGGAEVRSARNDDTVCKFYSQKPQEAFNLLFTEECYWAPFVYMLFYTLFTQFADCTSTDCK
jgi:hypothetical protein